MITNRHLITLATIGVAAGMALTGCSSTAAPGQQPPSPTAPATSPTTTTNTPTPTASPTPEETPGTVASEAPASAEEASELAFEAVEAHYAAGAEILQSGRYDDEAFSAVTGDPLYSQLKPSLEKMKDSTYAYEGESAPHFREAIPGKLTTANGEEYPFAAVSVSVCEDNTGVRVTDEDGDPVSSGDILRYEVDYAVEWSPEDGTWKVTRQEVPETNDGEARQC